VIDLQHLRKSFPPINLEFEADFFYPSLRYTSG
jgi:hypothetical protein